MEKIEMTKESQAALEAAKNWKRWGSAAAIRYAEKRGASLRLITIARQLLAVERAQVERDFTLDRSQAAGLIVLHSGYFRIL